MAISLVTNSPVFIQPKEGSCETTLAIISNLFKTDEIDQTPYLYGWLKIAIESLYSGKFRHGQALAIAGPAGCGKSLLQNHFTQLLGGRSAKPYQFMAGLTNFNGDLFSAEHLMIEDEAASTDGRNRRQFGSHIKAVTVNDVHQCHAKNRQAFPLKPFWRLSITLNDEPENLMILPMLDESLIDKMILLKAEKRPLPMPTNTNEERAAFMAKILGELPAFVHFLNQWEIPDALKSERFGITHFHHPELVESIDALAPETRLLNLIDDCLLATAQSWTGTAEEMESRLRRSEFSYQAAALLSWQNATGTYLGRLQKRYPKRFAFKRTMSARTWTVKA